MNTSHMTCLELHKDWKHSNVKYYSVQTVQKTARCCPLLKNIVENM